MTNITFKNNFFLFTLLPICLVLIVITFNRFFIKKDYLVSYEAVCDRTKHSCFVKCGDDGNCIEDEYYTHITKYAPVLYSQCGPDILQKRLHDILRTEHGLVYGVGSSSFGIDNFRIVSISFESAPENREKVKSIFTQVITSFLSDGITEPQFERAQSRAQVQIEFLKEKSLDIAEKVALLSTKKNKLHTIENEEKNITSLTKESVERTLKKVLSVQPVEIIATSVQE